MDPGYPHPARSSETPDQRDHESQILQNQFPKHAFPPPPTAEPATSSSSGVKTITSKLHNLWKTKVAPAFPEALTDVSIIHHAHQTSKTMKAEMNSPSLFPEITVPAVVRDSSALAPAEVDFLSARTERVRVALAKYLKVRIEEVDARDVPRIAVGGSGGGFRAMLGLLGYMVSMQRAGLWDCVSFVSGVSGSCWALGLGYVLDAADSEIGREGGIDWQSVIEHVKQRLSPDHPLSAEAVRALLGNREGCYESLGPLVVKRESGLEIVAMDLYSVFTGGHLFAEKSKEEEVDEKQKEEKQNKKAEANGPEEAKPITTSSSTTQPTLQARPKTYGWHKWSTAETHLRNGAEPLPILTAIRHERPWKDWTDPTHPFSEPDHLADQHREAEDAWFQWFEFTPFEIGCDEISAFVPTWAFGRPFEGGKSTVQLPEQSLSLLLGLCTSAPAGPMTSYLATISRQLPPGFIGNAIHELAAKVSRFWGKEGTDIFEGHHPLHACNEHNFVFHLSTSTPDEPRKPGLENSPRIHLIDSGMDNNCPTYVLLRPEREVDVVINIDASSDVQKDSFPDRVNQIGSRRGIRFSKRHDIKAGEDEKDPDRFKGLYAQIYDGVRCERPESVIDSYGTKTANPPGSVVSKDSTMIYVPLLPNERAVAGFDPSTAKFSGSYNLVWTEEQVEMLVNVCRANFESGEEVFREVVRDAWLKRKTAREGAEKGESK